MSYVDLIGLKIWSMNIMLIGALTDGIGSTLKLQESAQDYIITPTRDPLIITPPPAGLQ